MAALPPPRVPNPLVPIAVVLGFSLALATAPAPARAAVIGFRIEGRACLGTTCRTFPGSAQLWGGRYACQGRAARLQDLARTIPPKAFGLAKGGWTITARCVDVEGMPSA